MISEFIILDDALHFRDGSFAHALFLLQDQRGALIYRAVMLKELAYMPIEARENPDMMGKQWMAVRGLYNANVDFSYVALGAFKPAPLGVSQFYGAQAESHTEAGAIREAGRRMAAVEAVLANFPHSRLQSPGTERVQLLMERMHTLPHILAILGHPDPRRAEKGMGRDGSLGEMDEELASQQGEMLLRGLAKLRSDFVFAVTAAQIARADLSKALVKMSQVVSQVASRQRGAINAAFSMAIPLTTALSNSYASQQGRSDSLAQSQGETVSEGWGEGESQSWGHSVGQSQTHGEAFTDSVTVSDGLAHSQGTGVTVGEADTSSWGHTESQAHTTSHSQSVAQSQGDTWSQSHSEGVAHGQSHTDGQSHSVSDGVSSSWSQGSTSGSSQATTQTSGSSWSEGQSAGVSGGESSGWSAGASQSQSGGVSESASWSASQSQGQSVSHGVSQAESAFESQSAASSLAHSASATTSSSNSIGAGVNAGANVSGELSTGALPGGSVGAGISGGVNANASHTWGGAETAGTTATQSHGVSTGGASTSSVSDSAGASQSVSQGVGGSVGSSSGWSAGQSAGVSGSESSGWSQGTSQSQGGYAGVSNTSSSFSSQTSGVGGSTSHAETNGTFSSDSSSTVRSSSDTNTRGGFSSSSQGKSWGTAQTRGSADSVGGAHTESRAFSLTDVVTRSRNVSHGQSHTVSSAESVSEGWSEGEAVSRSYQVGRAHATGDANAQAIAFGGGKGFVGGFGGGIIPGFSIGRSWQTEDHTAMRLTELVNGLQSLLNHATAEGGFLTSAMLLVDERGAAAAQALVPQAFHGPHMPTPIMTVLAGEVLRPHVLALRPSYDLTATDPFGIGLWTQWGTLHTPEMLAALTAPNLFEEGLATTVQERMPSGLAFYPDTKGSVLLAHQVSPETGDLTAAPLKVSRDRHFHTAFVGDTGYGKSVAAVRLAVESTAKWQMRTIVLDFGAGWRQLLNEGALRGRVEIRQLSPGGVRPLRWNPLQIGRHILPEVQWRAFCDIFGTVARLGVRRQVAELREALRQIYLQAGVLVDDPELPGTWSAVRRDEEGIVSVDAGTPLSDLEHDAKQRLAVERSKRVGLSDLYQTIEHKLNTVSQRNTMLQGVLEGILFRLHPLVQGAAARQYAAGEDAIDINEVVPGEWGLAILEGGAFLDEFSKAFLLGWTAWHIYNDAVIQRIQRARHEPARIQIVFEEANKILSGVDLSGEEDGGAASTAEQFASMWRDSRKYGIWLHLITQSPSLIPSGILSSCNNLISGQVKNRKDQDVVIGMLHKSPVGFTDEVWRRFLASLPVARSVVKLGYAFDRALLEPIYVQPLLVEAEEPTDAEIERQLGRIAL